MAELRYPKYDLDQSIDVARKIAERGVGATMSSHELAAVLEYSGTNNGAYLNRIAAARLFGLIDGQADAIRATERGERIVHPDYPETAARARLEAFRSVPLYDAFLDGFRGRTLPDRDGLINTLTTRYRVPPNEAGKVLGRMILSADQAGLFQVAGHSRMIEPTFGGQSRTPATADVAPTQATTTPVETGRRFPKIIEGALDLMPAGPPWDEAEYREWLSFFDQACRVYYRISRGSNEQ